MLILKWLYVVFVFYVSNLCAGGHTVRKSRLKYTFGAVATLVGIPTYICYQIFYTEKQAQDWEVLAQSTFTLKLHHGPLFIAWCSMILCLTDYIVVELGKALLPCAVTVIVAIMGSCQ